MNANNPYPLRPEPSEERNIEESLRKINENLERAVDEWANIKERIGRATQTVTNHYDLLRFGGRNVLFDSITENMYKAVLLVSIRYNWRPEEILALWQIEGLPTFRAFEQEAPASRYLPIVSTHGVNMNQPPKVIFQRSPRDEDEARAWARSRVLYLRWGLDKLMPHEYRGGDNVPLTVPQQRHDGTFKEGFESECKLYLEESPFEYLSSEATSPFEVRRRGGNWEFRTHPEYQATMLALQHSRYKQQWQWITQPIVHQGSYVYNTRFPAMHYLFFNSRNAKRHIEEMAKRMVNMDRRRNPGVVGYYGGNELYEFFISTPIPQEVISEIRTKDNVSAHSYVNALRFEYLRQVYSVLFDGVPVEKPEEPLLRELQGQ